MNIELENKLISLVSGNIEGKDREEFVRQIQSDPVLLKKYQDIKNAWALSSYNKSVNNNEIDASYSRFVKKVKRTKRLVLYNYLKYAAVILLFFSIGIISNKYISKYSGNTDKDINFMNELIVPNGDNAELTLVDGTKVWLNSGTTFQFPSKFRGQSRKVKVIGEAFFEVTKNKKAFIVSTNYGDIKVLGTSFNVRAYENMNFQTNLVEGSIQFSKDSIGKILIPGEQLLINSNNKIIISQFNNPASYAWKDGGIMFQNERLEDVIKKLERHYDITINLDPQLFNSRFTGKIYNESIEEVIILINKVEPIRYSYNKKEGFLDLTRNCE